MSTKSRIISLGAYKPSRWLFDHVFNPRRGQAHRQRVALYKGLIRPGSLCFDVGANIGDYTAALLAVGARVIAVDPQPSSVLELKARFSGEKRVVIEPVALGYVEGHAQFYVRREHEKSGLVQVWETSEYDQSIQVPIRSMEALIRAHGVPQYIKIDVEGYELEVIRGLSTKVHCLSFEFHMNDTDVAQKLDIIQMLARFGELTFNLVPYKEPKFYWDEFVPAAVFLNVFPSGIKDNADFAYGDVFVKII